MATDGRQGIAAARTESPDLILMDMSLPEIDGWEADAPAEVGRRDPTHTGHRADGSRDVERPPESSRGGLRRLRHEAGGISSVCWRRYKPCSRHEEMTQ